MSIKKIFALALVTIIFIGCEVDETQNLPSRDWQLVWSDEFNMPTGSSPDPANWTYDLGRGTDGWGNQELQSYTNDSINVSIENDSVLAIAAVSPTPGTFTSARIKTQGLHEFTYGRFEASIQLPYGTGIWPAFWMLGADVETVGWPQTGEIDIMEARGQEPSVIHGSLHGPGYFGGSPVTKAYGLQEGRFDTEFHVFAVEWFEDRIDFFVDDFLYQRVEKDDVPGEWVYDHDFFLLLNVAVGGNYVGFPNEKTVFPQKMKIDYVRVYTLAN